MPDPREHPLWRPYAQMKTAPPPLEAVRTQGSRIVLADGRELVDGVASWWTAVHGYNPPHIRRAVAAQLEAMPHVMFGGLTHAPAERLARRLAALLPGALNHVFFSDSGSVAVEVAMKAALQVWLNRGVAGRTRFLAFRGGYHGDTLATMSVCDPEEGMHHRFAGALHRQVVADLPRTAAETEALDALLRAHRGELAAVIVEPVAGSTGVLPPPIGYLDRLRAICDRHGILLIFDEVITGFGRTGTAFAAERFGVTPDIVTMAKGLTNATVPMGAVATSGAVYAVAAALATLDVYRDEGLLTRGGDLAAVWDEAIHGLRGRPHVTDIRTIGLMAGIDMAPRDGQPGERGQEIFHAAFDAGLLIRVTGDTIALSPPLIVSEAQIGEIAERVGRLLDAIA